MTRSWRAIPVASVLLLAGAACGAHNSSPNAVSSHPSLAVAVPVNPPPPGAVVPPQIRGLWAVVGGYRGANLTLTEDGYRFLQSTGSAVVNGDEIDFFRSPNCVTLLGYDAVGRYRWSLVGNVLHFSALAPDPCERKDVFDDASFTLIHQLT